MELSTSLACTIDTNAWQDTATFVVGVEAGLLDIDEQRLMFLGDRCRPQEHAHADLHDPLPGEAAGSGNPESRYAVLVIPNLTNWSSQMRSAIVHRLRMLQSVRAGNA